MRNHNLELILDVVYLETITDKEELSVLFDEKKVISVDVYSRMSYRSDIGNDEVEEEVRLYIDSETGDLLTSEVRKSNGGMMRYQNMGWLNFRNA